MKAMPLRPNTPKRKTPQRLAITSLEVPEWVMPAIRQLCKKMGVPAAPHHIFAGVSSILSASSSTSVKTPALIVAIYFFVTTRLSGTAFSSAKYPQLRSRALEILEGVAGEDAANNVIDGADIDECMRQVKSRQWTEMDWFANVPAGDGVGADEGTDEAQGEGLSDEDAEEGHLLPLRRRIFGREDSSGQDYLQAGLGTMV